MKENNSIRREFEFWFEQVKDKSPMIALGFSAISLGLFIITISVGFKESISTTIQYIGTSLAAIGLLGVFIGFVKAAFRK